jgi:hypothetical protein
MWHMEKSNKFIMSIVFVLALLVLTGCSGSDSQEHEIRMENYFDCLDLATSQEGQYDCDYRFGNRP